MFLPVLHGKHFLNKQSLSFWNTAWTCHHGCCDFRSRRFLIKMSAWQDFNRSYCNAFYLHLDFLGAFLFCFWSFFVLFHFTSCTVVYCPVQPLCAPVVWEHQRQLESWQVCTSACTLRRWRTLCSRHSSRHTLKGQESIQKSKSCNLCLMTTYHSQWMKPTTVLLSHPHPTFYAFMLALLAHALHVIATSNFKPELSWVLRLYARNVSTLAVTHMNRILLGWNKPWYGYTILRSNCLHILL